MTIGALAGFVLVFVVTVVTMSAVGGLVLGVARGWLQKLGPMAERRAAGIAALAPVVIAGVAVSALVLQSTLGVDHCEVHGHHAHLCFTHGAGWLEHTWVLVAIAVAAATFVSRAAIMAWSYIRGARSIRALYALSRQHGGVRIVESERAFCFAALRGVFVSSRVWSALSAGERDAVVAHEQAHLRHGDLYKRAVLEVMLLFAAPLVGERIRTVWLHASERLCDARAASAMGEPETVARAMVSVCRIGGARPVSGFAFTPAAEDLAARVRAVLACGPLGERAAVALGRVALVSCIGLAIAGAVAAEPIHHAFETLLG